MQGVCYSICTERYKVLEVVAELIPKYKKKRLSFRLENFLIYVFMICYIQGNIYYLDSY